MNKIHVFINILVILTREENYVQMVENRNQMFENIQILCKFGITIADLNTKEENKLHFSNSIVVLECLEVERIFGRVPTY